MSQVARLLISDADGSIISPRIYGHFAEHLGRCCYGGLWVGTDSQIPNTGGFRTDIVSALQAMGVPLLRWPGGCYADHYHWRDGIGDPETRPKRLGLSCGLSVVDDNSLGTHEFLEFCRLIGSEPYLAGNMGSGSVQELCDWVEYCNSSVDTSLVSERKRNGSEQPFGIRLWGVGNENWGCGGCYDPEAYGLEYRRYASMIRHVDPGAELVACGHDEDWNRRLIPTLRRHADLVSHYSIHRYWIDSGPGVDFSEDHYYRSLDEADATEDFVMQTRVLLDQIDPQQKIGIALDEWGVWHPEARSWGSDACGDISGEYLQPSTQRDAILAAVALEGFHRQSRYLSMANLAQIVNVLHAPIQTEGEAMWLTPTYYVLQFHRAHFGHTKMTLNIENAPKLPSGKPALSGVATTDSGAVSATLVNRSFEFGYELETPTWAKNIQVLDSPTASSVNSAVEPGLVAPKILPVSSTIRIPAHSVVSITG